MSKIRMTATLELEYEFDTEGYNDLDNVISSVATDEFRNKIEKDIKSGSICAADFDIQIVGRDENKPVNITIPLKVRPGERNVNGILYEEESYKRALEEFVGKISQGSLGRLLIDRNYEVYNANKTTKSYYVPFDKAVGIIEKLDIDNYTADVKLFDDRIYGGIDSDDYRIGCLIMVDSKPIDGKFIVECIKGFTLIPKEDVPNGSNNPSY